MENIHVKNILGLQLPTDPRWINLAEMQLEEILTDHAYCEQKAATTCITLLQKNSEKELLVEELSPIVTEEWGHFRQVPTELKKRNLVIGFKRLREGLDDNHMRKFYRRFMESEAGHYNYKPCC